ncbi:MAG: 30S ribosomal protein S27ae [Candidatus Hodarchaeota archaeon]
MSKSKGSGKAQKGASRYYEVDYSKGQIKRLRQECPRCRGVFLADHQDRRSCGSCGYSEFK